jgi:hypothetical protein
MKKHDGAALSLRAWMQTKDKAGGAAPQTVTSMPWPLLVVPWPWWSCCGGRSGSLYRGGSRGGVPHRASSSVMVGGFNQYLSIVVDRGGVVELCQSRSHSCRCRCCEVAQERTIVSSSKTWEDHYLWCGRSRGRWEEFDVDGV